MVYAYDNWVQLPTKDIYDTQMMAMAINAAKDMYEKGQDEIKDFTKTYGDFMSPFAKDMERYGEMVGGVRDTINRMYAAGIDPLRSAEGRAMLSRLTNSINPAEYNRMRTNAKLGFAYLDEVEKARAKGEFDEDYENWNLQQPGGPGLFDQFSSEGGKMWNRPSPSKYQDQNTMVSPLFDHMQDEYIDSSRDGQYDYSGVSRDRRALILQANLGSILKTPNGRYHYELAKQEYARRFGKTPTEAEALSFYQDQLLDASDRFEHRTRTENKDWARRRESQLRMAEDDHRTANDIRAYERKAETDYDWETKKLMDTDRDKKISEEERKTYVSTGGASSDKDYDIVADSARNPGSPLQYDPNDPYKSKVTPIDGRIEFHAESKKGAADMFYTIPNDIAEQVLVRQKDDQLFTITRGEMNGDKPWYNPWGDPEGSDQVIFIPSGNVETFEIKGKKYAFMHGTINATGEKVLMRVKSNRRNYNK